MQASQKRRTSGMSDESLFQPQFGAGKSSLLQYCTLESSSPATHTAAPWSLSFPAAQHDSPISGSCVTDDASHLQCKLRELETAMLGPDRDSGEAESWARIAGAVARRDVKQVLIVCARAVADDDLATAQWLMDELRRMVSVSGDPMQRLGAYMLEGLVARVTTPGSSIARKPPARPDRRTYTHILHELCPYFKFGYMSANGAIAEAMKHENRVHIVDFQIGHGAQWLTLIQAFAGRPGGPPRIRITAIDGPALAGRRLAKLAETFRVPFEFRVGSEDSIETRPGEALAVNFAFALHRVADESVSTENRRDRVLRLAKRLGPRVVTLVEQESNTNTAPFLARFVEALEYYSAMFGSIHEHKERVNVEQHCLAREVVNVIACEGSDRVERHELLGKWRCRLRMAGFRPYPLSSVVNATIKSLLTKYSNKYRLEERDGALYLGWMDRYLVTSSAWQ